MRSVTPVLLLACAVQTHAQELPGHHKENARDVTENLLDKLVNKLFGQVLKTQKSQIGQLKYHHKNFMVPEVRHPLLSFQESRLSNLDVGRALVEPEFVARDVARAATPLSATAVATAPEAARIPVHQQDWQILPDIWETLSTTIPHRSMLVDPIHGEKVDLSYSQVNSLITTGAAAMQQLGIEQGDCVSVFSENSHKWFVCDQAVMKAGGCNAVRGAAAPVKELQYIYDNSESKGVVIENPRLLKSLYDAGGLSSGKHGKPAFIIVLFSQEKSSTELTEMIKARGGGTKVLTYEDFLALSSADKYSKVSRDKQHIATFVYTSGTTSNPKGVMLTHENLLYQVIGNSFNRNITLFNRDNKYDPSVGDVFVSILPCWHIFERTVEYYFFSRGVQMVYSNFKTFKNDLPLWKPHFLVAVPRLFENIHKGIQQKVKSMPAVKRKLVAFFTLMSALYIHCMRMWQNLLIRASKPNLLERLLYLVLSVLLWPLHKAGDTLVWKTIRGNMGGRLKVMVSGGSSNPLYIEKFFDRIGINVIVGYGLTETSPVICNRVTEHNIMGTVGYPPPCTQLKIVDVESRQEVAVGEIGVVMARGPGITKGYKSNEEATQAAFDKDGFFDTGDLGRINPSTGDLIITGRAKDTIVLSNGENIEPQSIEEALAAKSSLIEQVMLVGQDEQYLSAIIVASVPELVQRGFIDSAKGKELEKVLGPTPLSTGPAGDVEILRKEGEVLRKNPKFMEAIMADVKRISAEFQKFERVIAAHVVLEPFSVANDQATQTLKVKRRVVTADYAKEIAAFYKKKG